MQYNVYGSKHLSNVQGNEENFLKSETNTETETNFQILPIYFFFGIKNVRVGRSIGNTPIFFLGLTDQDKMSNLHRGHSIDASYQVSVHLAKMFQRRFLKICQSETRIACGGHVW